MSKIGFVVINATLNPLLYYFRMSGFKTWLNAKVVKTRNWNSVSHFTTYGDVAMETIKSSGSCTPRNCATPAECTPRNCATRTPSPAECTPRNCPTPAECTPRNCPTPVEGASPVECATLNTADC